MIYVQLTPNEYIMAAHVGFMRQTSNICRGRNDARSIVHSMLLQALSGTQIRVYIFLQQHGEHTTIEIKRALNMKNYTVVTALHDLQFVKLIKKDKKGKGAKWKIR